MRKVIFFTIFFFGTIGLAQFSGPWNGRGKATDSLEKIFNCPSFRFTIEQSPETLMIHNGFFGCNPLEMDWEFPRFEIKASELFFKGKKIGTLTNDRIKFDININGYIQRVDISRENDGIVYREFWINSGANTYIMSFEGNLKRLLD